MLASSSGPLGALLMIAPLAAIPVFAIIGVPQFVPVSASSNNDDEITDLGDAGHHSLPPARQPSRPTVRRSADDLFAAVDTTASRGSDDGRHDSSLDRDSARVFSRDRAPDREADRSNRGRSPIRQNDPLDEWEVVSDMPDRLDRLPLARQTRQTDPESTGQRRPVADDLEPKKASRTSAESFEDPLETNLRRQGIQRQNSASTADGRSSDGKSSRGFSHGLIESAAPAHSSESAEQRGNNRPPAAAPDRRPSRESRDPVAMQPADMMQATQEQNGWRNAARRLKELGIRKYRLLSQIEEQQFLFRCEYPTPDSPHITELFEAVAETPLEAVLQALVQIDEWLGRDDGHKTAPLE